MATNREPTSANMMVKGIPRMNCPVSPVMNNRGINARTVVRVEDVMAPRTSPLPSNTAAILSFPRPICRWIFSTTTMPLSTNIPRTITIAAKVIWFRV